MTCLAPGKESDKCKLFAACPAGRGRWEEGEAAERKRRESVMHSLIIFYIKHSDMIHCMYLACGNYSLTVALNT